MRRLAKTQIVKTVRVSLVALALLCSTPLTQPGYAIAIEPILSGAAGIPVAPMLLNFAPDLKPPIIQSDLWMPVPNWMAGTWEARSQLVLYSYNYQEGRNVIDEPLKVVISRSSTIGTQQDSKGQIWHYSGAPYVHTIKTPNYIEHQQINRLRLLASAPGSVTVRSLAKVTHTDIANHELIDEFIEQTDTTYEPLSEQMLKVTFLVQDFDTQGKPRNVSKSVCTENRVKPFRSIEQDERGCLRELFIRFEQLNEFFSRY